MKVWVVGSRHRAEGYEILAIFLLPPTDEQLAAVAGRSRYDAAERGQWCEVEVTPYEIENTATVAG